MQKRASRTRRVPDVCLEPFLALPHEEAARGAAANGRAALIGVVLLDWDDAVARHGVQPAELSPRLGRLSELGVDVVLVASAGVGVVDTELRLRPAGPGRLVVWSGESPDAFEIAAAGTVPVTSPGRRPLLVDAGPEHVLVVADVASAGHDEEEGADVNGRPHRRARPLVALLDDIVAAHSAFPPQVDDPSWTIEVDGFDPLREREVESWLTLANGRTGTRGSVEEGRPGSAAAVYVAGVYVPAGGECPGPELARGPEWTRLDPQAGGVSVDLDVGETIEHRRVLDLRQGILFREWRQRLRSGREWSFRSARFASLADRQIMALSAEATCDGATTSLGGAIPPPSGQDEASCSARAPAEDGPAVVSLGVPGGTSVLFAICTEEGKGRLERLVAVERVCAHHRDDSWRDALARAEGAGVARLRARHRGAWRERWRRSDVVVEGDPDAQRCLRFALYHLMSSGDPESDMASIGARGLTGPGYWGHVFWDTEVFALPFFIWTHPPTARALLSYRYRTLPAARAKAAALGYSGALYAWESADTGEETAPLFVCGPDGTRVDIVTGLQEHHISADVAWATWQYWRVTADDGFLVDMGAEIVLETARFWASRAELGRDGRYHINGVVGPDEYHEGVDDNAFTNVMGRWNLRTALEVCELLPVLDPSGWAEISCRLDLRRSEQEQWRTVAEGLVDGFDATSLLYEQFAGFFHLEDVRAVDLAPRPFTADTLLGAARVRQAQVVKQADVLMLAHMLPDVVPPAVALANYRYYDPRTSHGSSLSPAVHAAVASRIGAVDDALRYFRIAAAIDLDDRMGNAAKGVHVATMGGLWQAAVIGFCGIRAEGDALRVDPRLPGSWERLAFPLCWRGTYLDIDVGPDSLRIHLDRAAVVAVGTDSPARFQPGDFVARRTDDGWTALEPAAWT
jgi:trehalose/maltose hydrolase-like predicted phosphorylase